MTSLLRSMIPTGSSRSLWPTSLSFQNYLDYFNFGGSTYPLGMASKLTGTREEIDSAFIGLVQGAYQRNGIVFAVELARFLLFSEARLLWAKDEKGRPGELYDTSELELLRKPWPGATTGDLLTRMLLSADFAGTAFVVRRREERNRIRFIHRPDWVTFIAGVRDEQTIGTEALDAELLGILYHPGGPGLGKEPEVLLPDEVAVFAPIPDPMFRFRGMAWPVPVLRELQGHSIATDYELKFFENGATPNLVVEVDPTLDDTAYKKWVRLFKAKEPRGRDVFKTLYLGGGAKASVIGSKVGELDLKHLQGAKETRIAAAGNTPPIIAGFSEGLEAATYSNYAQARRRFADLFARPYWRNAAGSLQNIFRPAGTDHLWYDEVGIAFLREDNKDRAEIQGREAQTIRQLTDAGFKPESVVAAVRASDWTLLQHTGFVSAQLLPLGAGKPEEDLGRSIARIIAPHLAGLLPASTSGGPS